MDNIKNLGWNQELDETFQQYRDRGLLPGRIGTEYRDMYKVYTNSGVMLAQLSGRFRHIGDESGNYPATGDWAAVEKRPGEGSATIHALMPRKSKIVRKVAGPVTMEQIAAANVDTIFIVMSLNQNFSIRRLERYLVMVWESNASPVIVLSKADLCDDLQDKLQQANEAAMGVPVYAISAINNDGTDQLMNYIRSGSTVALMGSSGVGKTTLINHMLGTEELKVQEIREYDGKGRHTTTTGELVPLPNGGVLIDTPGMREIQLWDGDQGIGEIFDDIEELSKSCRFKDCKPMKEPGCAVRMAIKDGLMDPDRLESYRKLQKELRFVEMKQRRLQKKRNGSSKKVYDRKNIKASSGEYL